MSIQKQPVGDKRGVDEDKIHWEEDLKPFTRLPRESHDPIAQRSPVWIPALVALAAILLSCSFAYSALQRNLPAANELIAALRVTPTRSIATQVPTDVVRPTATRYLAPTDVPPTSPPTQTPKPGAVPVVPLTVGGYARVAASARLRKTTSPSGDLIATISAPIVLPVQEGPVTAEGYTWWRLKYTDGSSVWTIEPNLDGAPKP